MRKHLLHDEIRHLDPIDGTRLAVLWSGSEEKEVLFERVMTQSVVIAGAPEPAKHRRRVSRRLVALAASLAMIGLAIALVPSIIGRTGSPAFAVRQLPDGVIEIENVADIRDAKGLEAELREFGIDAVIVTETASPSLVGTAQAFAPGLGDRQLPGLRFGKDGSPDVFRWRIDPQVFRDQITITLYVEANKGEAYLNAAEVFEPGEVLGGLQCALGEPLRAADVAARLPKLGITPVWYVLTNFQGDSSGGTSHSEQVREVPEGEVSSGFAVNDHSVKFEVIPDGVTALPWQHTPLSDVPCTEEQAARWRQ